MWEGKNQRTSRMVQLVNVTFETSMNVESFMIRLDFQSMPVPRHLVMVKVKCPMMLMAEVSLVPVHHQTSQGKELQVGRLV